MSDAGIGTTQRGSTTVTPMPCASSSAAASRAIGTIEPTATTRTSSASDSDAVQHVDAVGQPRQRRDVRPDLALRPAEHGRGVVDRDGFAELLAQRGGVARGGDADARDDLQQRQVPHAVVRGAVGTGDTRAVEHEGHARPVQGDVHEHLVERPVEERGVEGDDRVQAAERQPGSGGDRVLLGDADVDDAVGVPLLEQVQPGRSEHRRRDRRRCAGPRRPGRPARTRTPTSTTDPTRSRGTRPSRGRCARRRGTGRPGRGAPARSRGPSR